MATSIACYSVIRSALLLCAAAATSAQPFRDADTVLQLRDCAEANRWAGLVESGRGAGNRLELLKAARLCSEADPAAVRRMLLQSRSAPAHSTADLPHADVQEARLLLTLGEHAAASALLLAVTQRVAAAPPRSADDALNYNLGSQEALHRQLSQHFRSIDAGLAIRHAFAEATAWRMEGGGATMETQANLACTVALGIAMESKQKALQVEVAQRLFAFYPPGTAVSERLSYAVAKLMIMLDEQGHADAALALAEDLRDSGWPDAARLAAPYTAHQARAD